MVLEMAAPPWINHLIGIFTVIVAVLCERAHASIGEQEFAVQEFCETELFNATCGLDEVILMTHAQYGRMRMGRCVKLDYGHMGCASDVIEQTDGRCSGRRQCEIRIPDSLLAETLPCPDDLKPYLEASFRCVRVHSPMGDMCTKQELAISGQKGYISNLVTQETGCGGIHSPWVVTVQPGQTISVRLFDFAVSKRREGLYSFAQCHIYGDIRERLPSGLRNITVCGATKRDHVIYASVSNRVEIAFKTNDDESAIMPFYMFKFEAIGCPNKRLPAGSHSIRQVDSLVVKCNFTKDVFHLKCVGTVWVGKLRNCSKSTSSRKIDISRGDELGLPYGLSILLVLGIALAIGLLVLFVGLVFLKKQRSMCLFRNIRHENGRAAPVEETYDKHYGRSPWLQAREDGTATIASVGTKTGTWRESTYGHAPSLVSDLPPCTPLMDRGHRPPSYGQVPGQRPRLACGCYIDGNPPGAGDLCDYPSRHEILATTCPGTCPGNCTPPTGRTVNPERLVLKSGDRAQYFVVDATQIYTVRNDANNPRLQNGPKIPGTKTQTGVHMQTDDVKLKLKVTDKPQCTTFASSRSEDCDKSESCPESRPLIQNESPRRQSPRRQAPGHVVVRSQSSETIPATVGTCSANANNDTPT